MKYIKTYEEISIVEIEIEDLISEIKVANLKILKDNNKYSIYTNKYVYEFNRLPNTIPVNTKEKINRYYYTFKIFRTNKTKHHITKYGLIHKYEIKEKYYKEIKYIYKLRKNVEKYNL